MRVSSGSLLGFLGGGIIGVAGAELTKNMEPRETDRIALSAGAGALLGAAFGAGITALANKGALQEDQIGTSGLHLGQNGVFP